MYTDIHTDFILTPIRTILEQGINASQSLSSGIESYPISEYLLQSLFLRMTGASEQKMKCILWQMATDDFEYRYKYLNYQGLGECSTYASKNTVFKDLVSQIIKKRPDFQVNDIWSDYIYNEETIASERAKWEDKVKKACQPVIDRNKENAKKKGKEMTQEGIDKMTSNIIKHNLKEEDFESHIKANKRRAVITQLIERLFLQLKGTNLAVWRTVDLENFVCNAQKDIRGCDLAEKTKDGVNLLCGKLVSMFETLVYTHRNRTAHNTVVYQKNLPKLETLASNDYYLQNYFYRFAIVIVMDEVFLRLYKSYLEVYDTGKNY